MTEPAPPKNAERALAMFRQATADLAARLSDITGEPVQVFAAAWTDQCRMAHSTCPDHDQVAKIVFDCFETDDDDGDDAAALIRPNAPRLS